MVIEIYTTYFNHICVCAVCVSHIIKSCQTYTEPTEACFVVVIAAFEPLGLSDNYLIPVMYYHNL